MNSKRTLEQNKRIWVLVTKFAEKSCLSLEEAETVMRNRNEEINKTRRTSLLTISQADALIKDFEKFIRNTKPILTFKNVITKKQMKTIQHLFEDAGFYSFKAQQTFNMRTIKKPWPQTREDGVKVHEGLEAIIIRKNPREALLKRMGHCFYNWDKLTKWERMFLTDIHKQYEEESPLSANKIKKLIEIERKVLQRERAIR